MDHEFTISRLDFVDCHVGIMAAIRATLPAAIHSSASLRCDAGFNPRRVYPDVSLPRTRLVARTSRSLSVAASSPANSGSFVAYPFSLPPPPPPLPSCCASSSSNSGKFAAFQPPSSSPSPSNSGNLVNTPPPRPSSPFPLPLLLLAPQLTSLPPPTRRFPCLSADPFSAAPPPLHSSLTVGNPNLLFALLYFTLPCPFPPTHPFPHPLPPPPRPTCPGPASPPTLLEPLIPLGQSELRVSPLGIGTLQWGDPRSGFGEQYSAADLAEAFRAALVGGINVFDSAEVYGYQGIPTGNSSEQLLGRFVAEEKARRLQEGSDSAQLPAPVAATKFFTIPWTNVLVGGGLRFGRQSLIDALKASLQRLGMERVDLYQAYATDHRVISSPVPPPPSLHSLPHQIHFPFPTISNATLMDGLKQAHAEGLATAVGVSNYNTQQLQEAHSLLKAANIPLASNQVKYNLLDRGTETNGLLHACQRITGQRCTSLLDQGHCNASEELLNAGALQLSGFNAPEELTPPHLPSCNALQERRVDSPDELT
ncbi:unnamed protein product [Closterium sp. NIES-53]